jgi:hypothetical protein
MNAAAAKFSAFKARSANSTVTTWGKLLHGMGTHDKALTREMHLFGATDSEETHLERPQLTPKPCNITCEPLLLPSWLDGVVQRRSPELGAIKERMLSVREACCRLGEGIQAAAQLVQNLAVTFKVCSFSQYKAQDDARALLNSIYQRQRLPCWGARLRSG